MGGDKMISVQEYLDSQFKLHPTRDKEKLMFSYEETKRMIGEYAEMAVLEFEKVVSEDILKKYGVTK
jgi:hypothetical protein